MKKLKNSLFTFEVQVEGLPHTKENCEAVYGKNSFDEGKFNIQVNASMILYEVYKDAMSQVFKLQTGLFVKNKGEIKDWPESEQRQFEYYERKLAVIQKCEETTKYVRHEDLP